ncbi:hypothetical protein DFH08DRAFT_931014 [Mycena albidolilacea]|uniref:Uncharacterized protein n=1 Tax=Mycena albidolilacea TaxID=1033008 RepID=A0AAD7AMQ2_9AGAR|nr:hypothetical protein DFH08DRAFT_931014 [Mycena albidolilacea]
MRADADQKAPYGNGKIREIWIGHKPAYAEGLEHSRTGDTSAHIFSGFSSIFFKNSQDGRNLREKHPTRPPRPHVQFSGVAVAGLVFGTLLLTNSSPRSTIIPHLLCTALDDLYLLPHLSRATSMCAPPITLVVCALWHIGSVNGYIGPRQDPSSVASAHGKNDWDIQYPQRRQGCEPRDIAQPITQQITANPIDPLVRVFTWHSVNVSAGWYELIATLGLPNFFNQSNTFFVKNGTNVSCITPTPTSSSSFTPTDHTSSHSATSTASVSPSTGVPTVTPGPSKHKVNRGVIVGGAVGGVAALCAAITAYLYLMRLRRRRNIPLLHTPVPPVLLRPSSPPPMRSKGATAVVVTQEVQHPAVAASTAALNAPLPGAVETPEVHHPEQQRRRDLEIEERLRHVEEQLASASQPPAYN